MEKTRIIQLISKSKKEGETLKIFVKLFANLRENRENEQYMDLVEGARPKDIIEQLGIPLEDVAIIMINGKRVKPDSKLEENDTLAIFPPVGGG